MGMPGWGIACTVVSVLLCILGLVLFVVGYKMAKKYKNHGDDEKEFTDYNAPPEVGMLTGGARPMRSMLEPPSPVPVAVGNSQFSPEKNKKSTSPEAAETWEQAATSAAMAQQQLQLERDIAALENQKFAMDNKWEGPLTVKTMDGSTYTVDVVSTEEMTQIKAKISEASGIAPDAMKLSYGGIDLTPDTYMLGAFHIYANSTIHLIPIVPPTASAGRVPSSRLTAHNLESRNSAYNAAQAHQMSQQQSFAQPVASQQPSVARPVASQQPSVARPAASQQPSVARPAVSQQPSVAHPVASQQPSVAAAQPVASTTKVPPTR
eukprot:TRINITY_DN2959_c0_g1_i2.p1 TRINITY_DN2959_c0_g1~~TRINITY_DN2959_c0_g1_i2.p1  ORF type:complete len:321 (+),score=70.75 TRINITY_DN2959_c0_g1_i2:44-1006(+)